MKLKIRTAKGNKGTKIAGGHLVVRGGGSTNGKPLFASKARMNIHLSDKRGKTDSSAGR